MQSANECNQLSKSCCTEYNKNNVIARLYTLQRTSATSQSPILSVSRHTGRLSKFWRFQFWSKLTRKNFNSLVLIQYRQLRKCLQYSNGPIIQSKNRSYKTYKYYENIKKCYTAVTDWRSCCHPLLKMEF